MQGPEKNSYKEFDNEKKIPAARKFPSPPITFLMVRPLASGFSWETANRKPQNVT